MTHPAAILESLAHALADLPPDVRELIDLGIAQLCRALEQHQQIAAFMQGQLAAKDAEIAMLRVEVGNLQGEIVQQDDERERWFWNIMIPVEERVRR